ncbi:hypothetical protein IRP63_08475 [Clostridium botulinum]|uniref:Uncharacterized protein n=2 Tax=Clostridium botulinum TaxID=1491 RepID=A0A0A0IB12_CLOBO|nr:hypothetical protein [Clostridium botulinum]KEI01333.1 hypothetical protein Z952_12405 [Clostridium botulinum C/D str. BKT75002]KEI12806.1 hypothetical protein Z954_04930 [Clostridium botulinum C/D str. BKT2873]KGM98644.1 hypothetical protein Z955_10795 [Clostridium botulinum C/D str. DC5]KOC50050.1 hypothetical protein ADU89_14965 [Clostridium botulinum]KOC52215.1 hypothetical protein ADU90_14720 [Clostridium botulinum]
MKLLNNDFYTIRMSHRNLWNITYNKKLGIIYRQLINKKWSAASILQKHCNNSFATVLLPKNQLCLIHQTNEGNIVMSLFSNETWEHTKILKWKGNVLKKATIKALYYDSKIHIFYSISLTSNSSQTLFYQTIDLDLNLSKPISIDNAILNLDKPFEISILDNGSLVILYEKLDKNYKLVYKIFNCQNYKWSDCYTIDKNITPYKDFSLCCNNNTIHTLYIKNSDSQNLLIHCSGLFLDLNYITIFKSTRDIFFPCFFKLSDTIWDMWINNTSIYSCFSNDNGLNVSNIETESLPKSLLKTSYLSYYDESNNKHTCINYLYITPDNGLTFFPTALYNSIKQSYEISSKLKNNNYIPENIKEYIINTKEKLSSYEKKLSNKDQIINELNHIIQKEKNNSSLSFNKLNNIQSNYLLLKEKYDSLLNEKLKLEINTSKVKELTDLLLQKQKIISDFEKKFYDLKLSNNTTSKNNNKNTKNNNKNKNSINYLKNEIKDYKLIIKNLNNKLITYEKMISSLTSQLNIGKDQPSNKPNLFL